MGHVKNATSDRRSRETCLMRKTLCMRIPEGEAPGIGLASAIPTVDFAKINRRKRTSNADGWLRGRCLEAFMTWGGKATVPLRAAARGKLQQQMQLTSAAHLGRPLECRPLRASNAPYWGPVNYQPRQLMGGSTHGTR